MKNNFILSMSVLVATLLYCFTSVSAFANEGENRDNTPGIVTLTVSTKTAGGNYAPRHVLAIWLEKDGAFVKTRKAMANSRKQYLYTWKAISNYNVVDAITGSTLTSHQAHTVQWDCTDLDGNVVVDGTYKIRVEFTEEHAQGPLLTIDFTKGAQPVVIDLPNQQYFTGIQLTYAPDIVAVANFSVNNQQTCTGEQVVFTDQSTGATSWQWDFGADATPATATTQGPHQVSYSEPGNKTASLTINGTITQTINDIVEVLPDAVATFAWTQQSRTISFTNNSTDAIAYLWEFGDGITSTLENPVHTYAEDGVYVVSLIAYSNNCQNGFWSEDIIINTVGVPEITATQQFSIFPNPGAESLTISTRQNLENVLISIFNASGRQVRQYAFPFLPANSATTLADPLTTSGIYFLQLQSSKNTWREKLLVQ
ncbi:MAG: DUF2271 domain-containing protein [Clostridia bacterium]|nr:DUF2271 domain-containing protein [Clostridia bacterium]